MVRDGRLGDRLIASDHTNFAPRLGIAWSASPKWTFRAGAGIFYVQDQGNPRFDMGRTIAGRKRLELARALAIEPRLLLLDEVLAGLNPSEVRTIVPAIKTIAARGVTIVMIEHVMQAVMHLAERIFVLSEGRIIAEGPPEAIVADPLVVQAYLGRGAASRAIAAGSANV